jgi:hypothetical protein
VLRASGADVDGTEKKRYGAPRHFPVSFSSGLPREVAPLEPTCFGLAAAIATPLARSRSKTKTKTRKAQETWCHEDGASPHGSSRQKGLPPASKAPAMPVRYGPWAKHRHGRCSAVAPPPGWCEGRIFFPGGLFLGQVARSGGRGVPVLGLQESEI